MRANGLDAELYDRNQMQQRLPYLDYSDDVRFPIHGAIFQGRTGTARHDAVAWGYARAADSQGVDIIQQCEVNGYLWDKWNINGVETTKGPIKAGKVALVVAGHTGHLTSVDGLYLNGGWCYGGFIVTPASGWCYAWKIAKDEPHEDNIEFTLGRFEHGYQIDEKGAGAIRRLSIHGSKIRSMGNGCTERGVHKELEIDKMRSNVLRATIRELTKCKYVFHPQFGDARYWFVDRTNQDHKRSASGCNRLLVRTK